MLSLRLKTIASFVQKEDKVIDLGCDHGYLSIYLNQNIGCAKVIASDVNQSALASAINNIKKVNLENKIMTVLSDGLENIDTQNYDTLVIAGMGTSTILNILNKEDKLKNIKKLIIQSNNDYYKLRKEITKKNFYINNEKIVYDKGKYYLIIDFRKGKAKYNYKELLYGPILLKNKENKEYFDYLLAKQKAILKKVPKSKILYRLKLKKDIRIIAKFN